MFLQASVILLTGGVCLSACWDTTPPGRRPPRSRHPPREETPREQTPPRPDPPPGSRLRDTVNERPVRILLECILVYKWNQIKDLLVYFGSFLCGCFPLIVVIYPHGCWVELCSYTFIAYYSTARNLRPPQGHDIEHLSLFWMAWQFKEASPVGPFLIMPNKPKWQCSRLCYL